MTGWADQLPSTGFEIPPADHLTTKFILNPVEGSRSALKPMLYHCYKVPKSYYCSSSLSCFQRDESTITDKFPIISILLLLVFLYFFQLFPFHFYVLSDLVYPSSSRSSSWSFSFLFLHSILSSIFSYVICIICPNHLIMFFWIF